MLLGHIDWQQVDTYLKKNQTVIIPVGSTEQHSSAGLLGTDYMIADAIAGEAGNKAQRMVTPVLPFGMANHHLGFAGTISLNPTTFMAVVNDVVDSLTMHGFDKFFFINGHGGNIAPAMSAFSEITRKKDITFSFWSWYQSPVVAELENKLFGDKNGHHATASEIAITKYLYPDSFKNTSAVAVTEQPDSFAWPLSPSRFRATFKDGNIHSDPSGATQEHGELLFETAVEAAIDALLDFEKL